MGTNRLMTIFMFIAVFSLLTTSLSYNPPEAFATDSYADSVISAGEYGAPVFLTSGVANAIAVIGPNDNTFIQLALNNEIVVKFVDNLAYQSCDDSPDLRIHTFDTVFPANADVSVSDDGLIWHLVGVHVPDTNAVLFVDIDLDATAGVPQSISYVKLLTTYEDPTYPKLGFDLDAVQALFTEDQLCLPPPLEICEDDVTTLLAGQHIDVGDVTINDDGTDLTVTIQTKDGWQLTESHVHVGDTLDDFPLTKKGSPKVGHFEFSESHDPGTTEFTYVIPLPDDVNEDGIKIAVHAVVVQTDLEGEIIEEESAWKDGVRFVLKGNWATFNTYKICVME